MSHRTTGRYTTISKRSCNDTTANYCHCSREEAARRVGNPDRVERRKLTSPEGLMRDFDRYDFASVPRADCLKLDTGTRPAEATAGEIVRPFGLDA